MSPELSGGANAIRLSLLNKPRQYAPGSKCRVQMPSAKPREH
jgi:hypothetical protein